MPDFKTYLRNFSKTLGILKPSSDVILAATPTQAASYHDFTAPCDGFMSFNITTTYYWVTSESILYCQGGDSSTQTNLGDTIPVKKGRTYSIWSSWTPGSRYEVKFIPLMNTN